MPSCSVSMALLVLLGGFLVCSLPAQVFTGKLKRTFESIKGDLGLTQLEVNQEPLFDFVIRTINTSCQRKADKQLMNATLDVYIKIISNVLHHHHHDSSQSAGLLDSLGESGHKVRQALNYFKKGMEELKPRLTCENHHGEDVLSQLENIKVDDPIVQKKALAQFPQIYQAASTLAAWNTGSTK